MRHLIADAIGAPAERELREIAGPHHDGVVEIGEAKQQRRAGAGLHILEGHVVDRLPLRIRMADLDQHLARDRRDVDLLRAHPEGAHQRMRTGLGELRGREARQACSKGCPCDAKPSRSKARAATISACVESRPPEMPSTTFLMPIAASRVIKPLHLDVEGLVAILVEECRVRGQEGKAVDGALAAALSRRGRIEREGDARGKRASGAMVVGTIARRSRRACAPGCRRSRSTSAVIICASSREALGLREELAILEHRDLAVPGEIGGRFSLPRRGIEIGRDAAHRLRAAKIAPRLRLADRRYWRRRDWRARGARHGAVGRGRGRRPDVLANLDMKDEILRHRIARKRRSVPKGTSRPAKVTLRPTCETPRREMALLVKLAIIRQIGLRHDAEQRSAMHDEGAVEQPAIQREGRADDQNRDAAHGSPR